MTRTERATSATPDAFERIFRAEYETLYRYAYFITGNGPASDDLVQDVFLRLWERYAIVDEHRSVRGLLFRMVRNEAYNYNRNRKRRAELLQGESGPVPVSSTGSPENRLAAEHLGARIRRWISMLPERQREALILTRYEGLSHHEAAKAMGISSRTVNNHLVRALEALRDCIRAYDPDLLKS